MLQPGPVIVDNEEEEEKKEDKETTMKLTAVSWRPAKKAGNMMFLHEFN